MTFRNDRSTSRLPMHAVAFCLFAAASAAGATGLPPLPADAFGPTYVDGRYVDAIRAKWHLPG